MDTEKSKISNIEWGLVIGALLVVDISQILIEWLLGWIGIGIAINWFLDIFVGMSFALYLHLRGEKMTDPKRALGLIGTFILEMIPVVDELPLWCLDGIYAMVLSKRKVITNTITSQITGQNEAEVSSTKSAKNDTDKTA